MKFLIIVMGYIFMDLLYVINFFELVMFWNFLINCLLWFLKMFLSFIFNFELLVCLIIEFNFMALKSFFYELFMVLSSFSKLYRILNEKQLSHLLESCRLEIINHLVLSDIWAFFYSFLFYFDKGHKMFVYWQFSLLNFIYFYLSNWTSFSFFLMFFWNLWGKWWFF